jgi:hypothetical protein
MGRDERIYDYESDSCAADFADVLEDADLAP